MNAFKRHGFIKGADLLKLKRDKARVKGCKRALEKLYTNKRTYKKQKTRKEYYAKKLRSVEVNILEQIDSLFLYQNKVELVNNKYNL